MTTDNTDEQPTPQPTDGTDAQDQEQDHGGNPANAEAAKWRHKAKDGEARAEAAELAMEAMQIKAETARRQVVDTMIGSKFHDTEDFWRSTQLDSLMGDETGDLDPAKVLARADELLEAHPHYATPKPLPPGAPLAAHANVVNGDDAPGAVPPDTKPAPTWGQALRDGSNPIGQRLNVALRSRQGAENSAPGGFVVCWSCRVGIAGERSKPSGTSPQAGNRIRAETANRIL